MADLKVLIDQLDELSVDIRATADQTMSADVPQGTAEQLENIIIKLQGVKADIGGSQHVFVQAYQNLLSGSVASFVNLSDEIGGEVKEQAALFRKAFDAQSAFIGVVSEFGKPKQEILLKLLQPTSESITEIQNYREKKRTSAFFDHLSAVSECVPALGWVSVEPKPGPYIKQSCDSGQYYSNRVLQTTFKGQNEKHLEWVEALVKVFEDLHEYVMEYHSTGLVWNELAPVATETSVATGRAPPSSTGSSGGDVTGVHQIYVQAFQNFLSVSSASLVSLSSEIGGDVAEQAALFQKALDAQSAFIVVASECKKPNPEHLAQLLQPTSESISAIQAYRENRRSSKLFNHLSAVSECVPALGWVSVDPKPGQYVQQMVESSQFYGNQVLQDFTGKDEKHVKWVEALMKFLKDLNEYIMRYHPTGLVWNEEGSPPPVY